MIKPKKQLVSIIIPVYNGENYLDEAIKSALSQTYENIEVLVINDGSTDGTENVALKYKDKIRYFKKENGGVSSALNLGIEKMEGDYFSWLSHDDLYYSDKIEIQMLELEKYQYKYKVITGKSNLINENGKLILSSKNKNPKVLTSKKFYKKNIYKTPSGCGFLIHKDLLKSVGKFNENYRFIQDADYWFRIAHEKVDVLDLRRSIVKTRVHPNQATVYLKHRYSAELSEMLKIESKKILNDDSNKELFELLLLRLSISGNKKLRKEIYTKYKKQHQIKLRLKLKYGIYILIGNTIYLLKKIKRKYVNLKYR